ncbi:MAG: ion channel [Dehalococcoidia bacterium]|nr:ion channel [Dehalococcoidia bacterium]
MIRHGNQPDGLVANQLDSGFAQIDSRTRVRVIKMAQPAINRKTFSGTAANLGLKSSKVVSPRVNAASRRTDMRRSERSSLPRNLMDSAEHYSRAMIKEKIPLIGAIAIALLVVGAGAIALLEQREGGQSITSFGEALWYGIVTMTTTGYGDFTPRTGLGRLVGVLLMLGGMTLMSLFTATLASVMVSAKIRKELGLEVIDVMNNHVLLCGWNPQAERVLEGLLADPGEQVVLVNELPEDMMKEVLLHHHGRDVTHVCGDPAVESVLYRANVGSARAAIVLADTSRGAGSESDERTTLVTLALKSLKGNIKVTAEAHDMKSEIHLRRAGADDIVVDGEFNSFLLSSTATTPGVSLVARRVLSHSGSGLQSETVPADMVGHSFGELFDFLRSGKGFLTVAIVTEDKSLTLDDLLSDDYSLVDQFIKNQFTKAGVDFLRFEKANNRVLVNPSDDYVIANGDTAVGIPRVV